MSRDILGSFRSSFYKIQLIFLLLLNKKNFKDKDCTPVFVDVPPHLFRILSCSDYKVNEVVGAISGRKQKGCKLSSSKSFLLVSVLMINKEY